MRYRSASIVAASAALSLFLSGPASAAATSSVSPWVLLSASASPASSRELCRERTRSGQERQDDDERRCALPVAVEGATRGATFSVVAYNSVPLLSGLAAIAGFTAYLLATSDKGDYLKSPISPD